MRGLQDVRAQEARTDVDPAAAPALTRTDETHPGQCLNGLFEAQVLRTPNATAVIYEGQSLSYSELNQRANQVAWQLRKGGIKPDRLIGIYLGRSVEMIVALLSVWKAGGAYVPLDPHYPAELLAHMCEDSALQAVLTTEELQTGLPRGCAEKILLIGQQHGDAQDDDNLDAVAGQSTHDLAYVIYTSGSTGRPKGVMIEQRNVVNLWRSLELTVYRQRSDCRRISVNASFSFDSSVKQIVQLLSGRTLVIVPQNVRLDAAEMLSFLEHHRLDCLDCTPTQLAPLVSMGMLTGRQYAPRLLLIGGERIDSGIWRTLAACSQVAAYNVYGPTECTVDATAALVQDSPENPVIGLPLPNTSIYILGPDLQPVDVGVSGECYIGGDGVGRGYLNRPELTAARFIFDPFAERRSARMYKSGDWVRRRPDGYIEFVGRRDTQVKIRGFRVELEEIEAQLVEHPQVKQAVVTAVEDTSGGMQLAAYVVPSEAYEAASRESENEIVDEFVQQWQSIHDDYSYVSTTASFSPSFSGWNSSYTGGPIPQEEMREWLDCTVARILSIDPQRVLEVGCGAGLLIEQLAPHCVEYHATDVSSAAVNGLRRWLADHDGLKNVHVSRRVATDFTPIAGATFDTIILNSVLQFFPNIEYLLTFLQRSIEVVAPSGKIFIGDIRNLDLLALFHCAIQLAKAEPDMTVEQVRARAQRRMEQDKDLVVAPEFFQFLPQQFPDISAVDIQLRRGRYENELTGYRYDVVLHVRARCEAPHAVELDYQGHCSLEELESRLRDRPTRLYVRRIENSRLARDLKGQEFLADSKGEVRIGELREALKTWTGRGEDPETFWALGERCDYDVKVRWSSGSHAGHFDVEFIDRALETRAIEERPQPVADTIAWHRHANNPIAAVRRERLALQLGEFLTSRLPQHMVPGAVMVLETLPLTPNGKIDRRALPSPEFGTNSNTHYEAPIGATEQALTGIWQHLLQMDRIGRQDNFFSLGGHSLSALKLVVSIAETFSIQLSVLAVFLHPTVRQMAEFVDQTILERQAQAVPSTEELEEGTL